MPALEPPERPEPTSSVREHSSALSPSIPPEALEVLLNTALDGFWDVDFQSDEVYCNFKLHQNLGYELPPGHSGRHPAREFMARYLHKSDLQRAADLIRHCEATRDSAIELEMRALSASGAYRWIRLHGRIVAWTKDGKAARALGWQSTATSSSRMEETLLSIAATVGPVSGQEFFERLVLELSRTLHARYCLVSELQPGDEAHACTIAVAANGAIQPNFQYELAGTPCAQVAKSKMCGYPEDVQSAFPFDTMLSEMQVVSYFGVPLRSTAGTPLGILAVMHDAPIPHGHLTEAVISIFGARAAAELERRRTERSRLIIERRFRELLERFNISATIFSPDGVVQFCNQHLASLLGCAPEEVVGSNWMERFISADERDRLTRLMAESGGWQHMPRRFTNQVLAANGVLRSMEWELANLFDPDGRFEGIAAIGIDLTAKLALEQQVRDALKLEAVGRLAGGVAHDFNNLLTVIGGYSRLASAQLTAASPITRYLDEIGRAGDRAADLTRQLLAFSRRQLLQPRLFSLNQVLLAIEPALRRLAGTKVELTIEPHASSDTLLADPQQIEQVVLNLTINARDAMPSGGTLLLRTTNVELPVSEPDAVLDAGRYVVFSMRDSGAGMSADVLAHLFEPFFTTKETGQGTGLGLSSSYGIIRQSGGDIRVSSTPGAGTCFRIYLPCAAPPPTDLPSTSPVAVDTPIILLVDDQPELCQVASEIMRTRGYQVQRANSYAEAMALLGDPAVQVSLLLTELTIAGGDGFSLAREALRLRPRIHVVFMSGHPTMDFFQQAGPSPCGVYLQKPFTPAQLLQALQSRAEKKATRILVVDDDTSIRLFLRSILEKNDYSVSEAAEGRTAMAILHQGDFDVLITDLVMPDQEGIETIRAARRDFPSLKIIAISGAFHGQFLKMAERLGANAILQKPIRTEDLVRAVDGVLKE